ncbi:hypothetical protein ACN27G_25950 [Plantactinospora sp. WMMB334]|uniref:hypothetical protein n=1 Tax=Plantactinospora sp. WMMB334 TaxID=3404119 RepID=UPI003B93F132
MVSDPRDIEVVEMIPEEEHDRIRSECTRLLGMDLDEFARRWYAGEYRDDADPRVTQVAMLLPDAE